MSITPTVECPQCGHGFVPGASDTTGIRVLKSLTPRQREVLYALSLGASNRELAQVLNISQETVSKHLNAIYQKTGMGTRVEAVVFMQQHKALAAGCRNEAKCDA
jgi:DNA-binding NarL/FixJ family response regulator